MNGIIFSVIIPHHNTPDLLQRCINSIPRRQDLEIIIVDDNSSEDIVDFNHFPGLYEENITILFSKEGRGAGYVRNLGVEKANGQWLIFADADDYFTEKIDEVLSKYQNDSKNDIVFFNAIKVNENNIVSPTDIGRYISRFVSRKPYSEEVLRYGYWTPWSRMFRTQIVRQNDIHFEEIPTGNDMMFVLQATRCSKRFDVVIEPVYVYYVPTTGSQTSKKYTPENRNIRIESRLKQQRLHKMVGYPFTTPLLGFFPVLSDKTIKPLLKKYNYSVVRDIRNCIMFLLARKLKTI